METTTLFERTTTLGNFQTKYFFLETSNHSHSCLENLARNRKVEVQKLRSRPTYLSENRRTRIITKKSSLELVFNILYSEQHSELTKLPDCNAELRKPSKLSLRIFLTFLNFSESQYRLTLGKEKQPIR